MRDFGDSSCAPPCPEMLHEAGLGTCGEVLTASAPFRACLFLFQLWHDPFEYSATKRHFLYTPNTASEVPPIRGPARCRPTGCLPAGCGLRGATVRGAVCAAPPFAAPPSRGSECVFEPFTLLRERCESLTRSKPQRGERVDAEIDTPVGRTAYSVGIRAAFGCAGCHPHEQPRPGPGTAR